MIKIVDNFVYLIVNIQINVLMFQIENKIMVHQYKCMMNGGGDAQKFELVVVKLAVKYPFK